MIRNLLTVIEAIIIQIGTPGFIQEKYIFICENNFKICSTYVVFLAVHFSARDVRILKFRVSVSPRILTKDLGPQWYTILDLLSVCIRSL